MTRALIVLSMVLSAALVGCAKDFCTQVIETDAAVREKMAVCPYFERTPEPMTDVRCSPWLEFCTEADLALILEQQTCLDAVAECAPGVEYEFTYAVAQCKKTNSKLTKDCLDTVTR